MSRDDTDTFVPELTMTTREYHLAEIYIYDMI